jgi:glycosyltransferase involved in cell wall biosynthesis
MKVIVVHNAYRQRGGEDAVVEQEVRLLRNNGIDVTPIIVSNDHISGFTDKLRVFRRASFDPQRESAMRRSIAEIEPDLVHIHNFFPLLTPAIHVAAQQSGAAVVQSLHNFRLLCAGGMFLRDGKICELCLHGHRHHAVLHRCYRDSLPGSLAVVAMQANAARNEIWTRRVHRFIALTDFARSKFIEGGLPGDRLVVKPNFVDDAGLSLAPDLAERTGGGLYVGRLSAEKGVRNLLAAWPENAHEKLTIVGDGPELASLKAAYGNRATFLGFQPPGAVRRLMQRANFLVTPSLWYEGFPVTIVEAFAAGLPVVATDIGSLSSIVVHGHNGLKVPPGDAGKLRECLTGLCADKPLCARLSAGARDSFERLYSPQINARQILDIYGQAVLESERSKSGAERSRSLAAH